MCDGRLYHSEMIRIEKKYFLQFSLFLKLGLYSLRLCPLTCDQFLCLWKSFLYAFEVIQNLVDFNQVSISRLDSKVYREAGLKNINNSPVNEHAKAGHNIDWNNVKILDKESN